MTEKSMLDLEPFVQLLNRETALGEVALAILRTEPVTAWPRYFATQAGWRSYGVFRALLSYAHELLDSDPRLALTVTTFVVAQVNDIDSVPGSVVLAALIRGLALKEHANVLNALGKYNEANEASGRAVDIFNGMPALEIDVASASLTRAISLHNLGNTREALELIMKSVRLFGKHAQPRGYLVSLQVCGGILVDLEEYEAARDAYTVARKIAEELNEPREVARMINNIAQCNVRLGELDRGEQQLQQAFRLFSKEQMDTEMIRTIGGLARILHKRGALEAAISTFQNVYVDMLHYGMLIPAAQVLVELTDVVTELRGNVEWAHDECAKLAEEYGDFEVPPNVRSAMAFVQRETTAARSVEQVREALHYVQAFFRYLMSSPLAPFAVPA
jgi:tetratricopeptide (TPR) repeat protein